MPEWLLANAAAQAAAATPAARDRVIDLVRAYALVAVVCGHMLMGLVQWRSDGPVIGNLLAGSVYLQAATWLLQVMPIFFIAGGAANAISWRNSQDRHQPYRLWLWHRLRRLLMPAVLYLLVMITVAVTVRAVTSPVFMRTLLYISTQLLWFLGIYVVVTAATPLMLRIHRRFGMRALPGFLLLAAVIDYLSLIAGFRIAGLLNFVVIWWMACQLGMLYLDRQLRAPAGLLPAAIAAAIALVAFGPYPVSLVGMPGDAISNMAPPTLVLGCYAIAVAALIELLRPRLASWATRPRVWKFAVGANLAAMSIYLWHVPTLVALNLMLHGFGFDQPLQVSASGLLLPAAGFWRHSLLLWPLVVVALYIAIQGLWLVEQVNVPGFRAPRTLPASQWADAIAVIAAVVAGVGLMLVSASRLDLFPAGPVSFSGLAWTSGQAVGIFAIGWLGLRLSVR